MYHSAQRALNAYSSVNTELSVISAEPHKLILMLFDGASAAVAAAKLAMQQGQLESKASAIAKALAIIDEGLKASLDLRSGGELAAQLLSLYDYLSYRLTQANLKNRPEGLDEVKALLAELRGAWASIGGALTTPAEKPRAAAAAR